MQVADLNLTFNDAIKAPQVEIDSIMDNLNKAEEEVDIYLINTPPRLAWIHLLQHPHGFVSSLVLRLIGALKKLSEHRNCR